VPDELAALVARLLAKRPADRPAMPVEVADSLALCLAREVIGGPASASARAKPQADRNRWRFRARIALGVAAGLLAAGTVILTLVLLSPKRDTVPGTDRLSAEGPLDGDKRNTAPNPRVLHFDVSHGAVVGDMAIEKGLFGVDTFSARLGDRAKVSVTLSRPAYGYLIACAADGKEYLLDPPSDSQAPPQAEKLQYPQPGQRIEYALDDGVGLHVFLAAVSSTPLPTFSQWQKKHGRSPWGKVAGRPGAVWRQVGGDLHAATAASPDVRGPGAVEMGAAPVERLVQWWRKQPGIADVGLTGFAVMKAE
jgi:hypothetical protein